MTEITANGVITDKRTFRQFGHVEPDCSGENHVTTYDLVFHRAVNKPLLVIEVNGSGLMAFSLGPDRQ